MVLLHYNQAIVVQLLSHVLTPWTAAWQALLSFTISWNLLRLTSIELVMLSNHLILCSPSPFAFSINQVGYLNSLSLHLLIHESILGKHLIGVFMNIKRKCMWKKFCTFLHSVDAQCIMITIIAFWVAADTQVSGNPSINSWEIFNDCF